VKLSLGERFWRKVYRPSWNECWLWTGGCSTSNGKPTYGNFAVDRKAAKTHRVAYELLVGPIPPGMTLDHTCLNKLCVNPSHLDVCTLSVNISRSWTAGTRTVAPPKKVCRNGHAYTEENTYYYGNTYYCRECNRLSRIRRWERGKGLFSNGEK
jgi:hypothetical protein